MHSISLVKSIFLIGFFFIMTEQLLLAETPTTLKINKNNIKKERKAKLTIEGKGITKAPTYIDRVTFFETDRFILPEKEGEITIKGHYQLHGSVAGGYALSGPSYQYGYVKNDELVITAEEWFWNGESMKRTELHPHVHIPLKNGAKVTQDFHYSMAGAHSDTTGIFMLSFKDKEEWRFTIFQKDKWVRGNNTYATGVVVKVRTVIDIEIEDGKYKKGTAKATFLSIKGISEPPDVADCTVQDYHLKHTAYTVSGKVIHKKNVKLEVAPENKYIVNFDCLIDEDKLEDIMFDKMDANRKGNKVKIEHRKIKRNGSTVEIEIT